MQVTIDFLNSSSAKEKTNDNLNTAYRTDHGRLDIEDTFLLWFNEMRENS